MTFFELVALAKAKGGSQLSMFHFKGAVNTINDLPETGEDGDVYLVDSEDSYFAWDGEGWTDVGNIFTIEDEEDLEKARTALQPEDLEPYRTAEAQDEIDAAQDDRLDDLEQDTTAATIGPAPIVTFDASAADMPLKQVVVNIEPVQAGSGEPSPDNVRPISGWTGSKVTHYGANLLDGVSINRGVYVAASGREQTSATGFSSTDYVPISDDVSILTNFTSQLTSAISAAYYDASKVFISRQFVYGNDGQLPPVGPASEKLILPADAEWLRVNCYYNEFAHVAISDRDIDNINIPFPDSAGTVYGGTLTINADGNGELAIDRAMVELDGTETYQQLTNARWHITIENCKTVPSNVIANIISDSLVTVAYNNLSATNYAVSSYSSSSIAFHLSAEISTTAQFKQWLSDNTPMIVFELVSPVVVPLSAQQITTLLGTNNVWADCGDVTVTYGAYLETLKACLDRTNSELDTLRACIAPIEDGATASQAYAAGAYFFRNGSFCTALTAISVGAAFTLGTNYQATTVAAALIALQS